MDYKLAAHSFNEVLTWMEPVDEKMGFLSDEDEAQNLQSLRCAVQERVKTKSDPFVEGGFEAGGALGLDYYTLTCWAAAMVGLPEGQECELSKYGRVKVLNLTQVGEYGRYGEISVEKV